MKVLLVGGSGSVGSSIAPYLATAHELRVLDVVPPADRAGVDFVEGSITDPDAVSRALDGMDTFINLVMRQGQGGLSTDQDERTIIENYEVNTLGLHILLWTARQRGILFGVHTSTLSVHWRGRSHYPSEEGLPLDSPSVYGLTKGLGEHICAYFARWFDMRLLALRITGPRTRERYLEEWPAAGSDGTILTDEEDLATAYLAAVEAVRVGPARFDAVFIAGDEDERVYDLSKARRLLGWAPRSHATLFG